MYICSIYIVYNLQAKYLIGIERLFINLLVIYFVDATRYIELQYLPTSSVGEPVPFFTGSRLQLLKCPATGSLGLAPGSRF